MQGQSLTLSQNCYTHMSAQPLNLSCMIRLN